MCLSPKAVRIVFAIVVLLLAPSAAFAQSFADVPPSREEYEAAEDLKRRSIVQGRPDGTFGPDDPVNRAEAITIVVRAVANEKNLPALDGCFPDVHGDHWYVRPVCYAQDLGWVGGYPDGTFQPVRTVAKAEFLKILFNAYGVDTDAVAALRIPLSADARDPDAWYFPYLSEALASAATGADAFGNLNPGIALTRAQASLLMYRFLLYREGQRDQAILTNAEKDVRFVFSRLDALDTDGARFAAGRVRLAAWGAERRLGDSSVVRVTVKLGDALRSLAGAYRLVSEENLDGALGAAREAYGLAGEADVLNRSATIYTDRVRAYAHEIANDIRAHQSQP